MKTEIYALSLSASFIPLPLLFFSREKDNQLDYFLQSGLQSLRLGWLLFDPEESLVILHRSLKYLFKIKSEFLNEKCPYTKLI